mmetsp:Transcript_38955/g.62797  ORF Transcript_38955/g.62797 Transcript_38955/m.62797 type:complete len:94 (+) Transcript_38955:10640-10921(+)
MSLVVPVAPTRWAPAPQQRKWAQVPVADRLPAAAADTQPAPAAGSQPVAARRPPAAARRPFVAAVNSKDKTSQEYFGFALVLQFTISLWACCG